MLAQTIQLYDSCEGESASHWARFYTDFKMAWIELVHFQFQCEQYAQTEQERFTLLLYFFIVCLFFYLNSDIIIFFSVTETVLVT